MDLLLKYVKFKKIVDISYLYPISRTVYYIGRLLTKVIFFASLATFCNYLPSDSLRFQQKTLPLQSNFDVRMTSELY